MMIFSSDYNIKYKANAKKDICLSNSFLSPRFLKPANYFLLVSITYQFHMYLAILLTIDLTSNLAEVGKTFLRGSVYA